MKRREEIKIAVPAAMSVVVAGIVALVVLELGSLSTVSELLSSESAFALGRSTVTLLAAASIPFVFVVALVILLARRNRALESEIVEYERAHDDLVKMAQTDELTGLSNRRSFYRSFEREERRARRAEVPLGVVLFDVDFFKGINDTYGHEQGDAALRELADLVQSELRLSDQLFRWGGEEFLVLATDTDFDGTVTLAERLRSAIERHQFAAGQITCSFGVAVLEPSESCTALLRRVDDALYFAKRCGRNRVEGFVTRQRVSDVAPAVARTGPTLGSPARGDRSFLRVVE